MFLCLFSYSFYIYQYGWSSIPSKSIKVVDAGLHSQKTLSKKTLTKFLMENFDRVKGALQ
jgi:hypothetical protein